MTDTPIEHRISMLETRVVDIEKHAATHLRLERDLRKVSVFAERVADQQNTIGQGVALMMERMGIPPIDVYELEMPTDAEIDALLEADCRGGR
ncbi:hypothetical protein [Nocardia arthritidis]|uniref:Uncharacterized protein n=1 Tax=Nocardia arthritidis TaxID=228602 RepID=A0A6G9Y7K8_9NOCA|nr:hypothetical protein [Nocardia arthritidis]QIS09202.1 hypothetical protein F5544_06455 [Nocardia arthritidis]